MLLWSGLNKRWNDFTMEDEARSCSRYSSKGSLYLVSTMGSSHQTPNKPELSPATAPSHWHKKSEQRSHGLAVCTIHRRRADASSPLADDFKSVISVLCIKKCQKCVCSTPEKIYLVVNLRSMEEEWERTSERKNAQPLVLVLCVLTLTTES